MDEADPVEKERSLARGVVLTFLALAVLVGGAWLWFGHVASKDSARRAVALARYGYSLSVKFQLKADNVAKEEHAFMEVCKRCAPAQECERDRLVISSGRASDDYNPCD